LQETYTDYVLERVKDNLVQSINYKIRESQKNIWYYFSLLFYLLNINMYTSRNQKEQKISLSHNKLKCSCGDDVFSGIPCRHILALPSKESDVSVRNLVFNSRWGKKNYIEATFNEDPDEIEIIEEKYINEQLELVKENGEEEKKEKCS